MLLVSYAASTLYQRDELLLALKLQPVVQILRLPQVVCRELAIRIDLEYALQKMDRQIQILIVVSLHRLTIVAVRKGPFKLLAPSHQLCILAAQPAAFAIRLMGFVELLEKR